MHSRRRSCTRMGSGMGSGLGTAQPCPDTASPPGSRRSSRSTYPSLAPSTKPPCGRRSLRRSTAASRACAMRDRGPMRTARRRSWTRGCPRGRRDRGAGSALAAPSHSGAPRVVSAGVAMAACGPPWARGLLLSRLRGWAQNAALRTDPDGGDRRSRSGFARHAEAHVGEGVRGLMRRRASGGDRRGDHAQRTRRAGGNGVGALRRRVCAPKWWVLMTTRLTDGDRVLALYTDRERRYWATLTPPGTARAIPLHRVAPLLARYRRGGWVDPTALARHRAAIANGERSLLASARDPDRRALTAALVRQLLAEVPGRSRTAAAALLGITRQSLLRAI